MMPPETEQHNLGVAVGRIEGGMSHVIAELKDMKITQKDEYIKLDLRITAVERFMWRFAGVVTLFPFAFTLLLWWLGTVK